MRAAHLHVVLLPALWARGAPALPPRPPAAAAVARVVGAGCAVDDAVSYEGNDISDALGGSAEECCAQCYALPGCNAWTLYGGSCYLKDAGAAQRKACAACTSGTLAAGCSVDPRSSYDGNDIRSATASSTDECCALCYGTVGCDAWTLYDGTCYLKDNGTAGRTACDTCTSGTVSAPHPTPAPAPLPQKWEMAGVTFTGGRYCPNTTMGSPAAQQSLQHVASTGANYVAIVVTGYQWNITSTEIIKLYDGSQVRDTQNNYYEFVTLTDAQVRAGIQQAHALGMKVMLKPHVDLLRNNKPTGDYWRGDIGGCPTWGKQKSEPFSAAQWDAWFASYAAFFLPYARMAAEEGVEMLSMNCELYCPNQQSGRWRTLVESTRAVYQGRVTVSQIHGHEEEMTWWDAVDVVGIDAYYGVSGGSIAERVKSWQQYIAIAEALHTQYGKPVAYTEIGYCSGKCSRDHTPSEADYADHAEAYTAVFEAFRGKAWFLGCFWWNWDTDPGAFRDDDCLTPQFKPAEDVLRRYYRAAAPKPAPVGEAACIGDGRCTC